MSQTSSCEYLEWDSQFFGKRIARATVSRLDEKLAAQIEQWCMVEQIDCLYFLADSADSETGRLAYEKGFVFVDARTTLARTVADSHDQYEGAVEWMIRPAADADIPILRAIARGAHRDSRFYFDWNFPVQKCDELYETWIEKSVRGWADTVFVAEGSGGVEGYLTCHLRQSGKGEIGLVAVAEKARGRGVGKGLVKRGVEWFVENCAREISVVTQGRNASAQRLYQRCGFTTQSVGIWFHRWFSEEQKSR